MTDYFRRQMARLSGLPFPPASLDTHWEGLKDLQSHDLERGVSVALRTSDRFPTPAEVRRYALETAPPVGSDEDRSAPLPEPIAIEVPHVAKPLTITREWRYYCEDCSDTSWRTLWCGDSEHRPPWVTQRACARTYPHGHHDYAEVCPCAERNPAVLRKRERAAQQAAHRSASARTTRT